MIRHTLIALLVGAALLLAGPTGLGPTTGHAQGSCMTPGDTRAAVSSGQARSFSAFLPRLQQQGKVVSSCLVRSGGGFAYVYKILKPDGRVISGSVSAR